jgi:nucleotide-binding universal stress UspA family protein
MRTSSPAAWEPTRDPRPIQAARPVVVGFDGSTEAMAAIAWAAATRGPIVVVRVLPADRAAAPAEPPIVDDVLGGHAAVVHRLLDGCSWVAHGMRHESPAQGLADAARAHHASAIVVGAHGQRQRTAGLGSASHRLIALAGVPVVVVPPQAGAALLAARAGR